MSEDHSNRAKNQGSGKTNWCRKVVGDWRGLLTRRIPQARQIVKTLLVGHLTFTPTADRAWEFTR